MACNPYCGINKLKDSKSYFRSILARHTPYKTEIQPKPVDLHRVAFNTPCKLGSRSVLSTSKEPSVASIGKANKKSLVQLIDGMFMKNRSSKQKHMTRMSAGQVSKNSHDIMGSLNFTNPMQLLGHRKSAETPSLLMKERTHMAQSREKKQRAALFRPHLANSLDRMTSPFVSLGVNQQTGNRLQQQQSVTNTTTNIKPPQRLVYHGGNPELVLPKRKKRRLASLKSEPDSKGSGIKNRTKMTDPRHGFVGIPPQADHLEAFYNRLCDLVEKDKSSEDKRLKAISKMFLDYAKLVEMINGRFGEGSVHNSKIVNFFAHFTKMNLKAYFELKATLKSSDVPRSKTKEPFKSRYNPTTESQDNFSRHQRSASLDKSTLNLRGVDDKSSDDSNIEKELELNQDDTLSDKTPVKQTFPRVHQSADPKNYKTNDPRIPENKGGAPPREQSFTAWPSSTNPLEQKPLYHLSQYLQASEHLQNQLKAAIQPQTISSPANQPNEKPANIPQLEYESTLSRIKISQIQTEKSIVYEEEKVKLFRPPNK